MVSAIKNHQMKKAPYFTLIVTISLLASLLCQAESTLLDAYSGKINITVSPDGTGDYTTITEAITNVPDNSTERTVMFIKNGTYYEKIIVPESKKNLVMIGEDVDSTIITYSDYAGIVGGTFNTATFRVNADNYWAMNITFDNSTGAINVEGSQALAIYTDGDKQVFLHCRFIGYQDTYYTNSLYRNYLKDCYIEGAVDFIFGKSVAVFDSCQIQNTRVGGGYITAASTEDNYAFGYVFNNCNITGAPGVKNVYLGRPWKPYAMTVFMNSYYRDCMHVSGWKEWDGKSATCFYAEYNNEGPGSDISRRVSWGNILTETQAADYTLENIFSQNTSTNMPDSWLPEVDEDEFYQILKANTLLFMDSANYNAKVLQVKFQGTGSLAFDPDKTDYKIELASGTTEVPQLEVVTEDPKSTINITYPDELPGITTIQVVAYDRSTVSTYAIYNSVDNAYTNALLDSIKVKNVLVSDFDPEKFSYDIELPYGSSKYFSTLTYKAVNDASVKITKPSALPGKLLIEVTAYDGVTTVNYELNISVSTGISSTKEPLEFTISSNKKMVTYSVNMSETQETTLEIFDINGKLIYSKKEILSTGENHITTSLEIPSGIYVYKAYTDSKISEGKLIID